ncbi:hypothetical protein D3C81_1875530 [compost metagenome]
MSHDQAEVGQEMLDGVEVLVLIDHVVDVFDAQHGCYSLAGRRGRYPAMDTLICRS